MAKFGPKSRVLRVFPTARLDYYELLRNNDKPCWAEVNFEGADAVAKAGKAVK